MLSQDKQHAKATLEERPRPPEAQPLPHRVSA